MSSVLVILVGQPNSGKSALLARLTGARVMTSNYPGTTVEVVSGTIRSPLRIPDAGVRDCEITVLDTPGIYSLAASSREQQVTRDVLEDRHPDLIVNVLDATNLARHLSLTLSLLPYGIPIVLALNSSDRLSSAGVFVDVDALSARVGAPAILTSALTGEGIDALKGAIVAAGTGAHTPRSESGGGTRATSFTETELRRLQEEAVRIAAEVARRVTRSPAGLPGRAPGWLERLEENLDRPLFSLFVLGSGLIAGWKVIAWALPFAEIAIRALLAPISLLLGRFLEATLPSGSLAATLAEAIPEGLILPMATVLPAMIIAYTLIAVLEDSGLLGRYAALGDNLTRMINLPGQALIPFMLAFGCRVPAVLAARILPSSESRRAASVIITTVVPCTATVSLALAALARFGGNPLVPAVAIATSIILLGQLLRLAWGNARDPLILELPPLRSPIFKNVLMKTQMRLSGFFSHVLPLVVGMNVAIRLFAFRGAALGGPAVSLFSRIALGIPPEALFAVVLTMFQRYLAPLFLLQLPLTAREATIAVTMVALGLPCLPSAVTLWREMSPGTVALSFLVSACLSVGWGILLNLAMG